MSNVEDLEKEIILLKKRIEILERAENKRKITKYINIIIKIVVFLLFIFSVYQGYNYIVNQFPEIVENKIKETIGLKR